MYVCMYVYIHMCGRVIARMYCFYTYTHTRTTHRTYMAVFLHTWQTARAQDVHISGMHLDALRELYDLPVQEGRKLQFAPVVSPICVCMYICMYVCMVVRLLLVCVVNCACMYVYMHVCKHVWESLGE